MVTLGIVDSSTHPLDTSHKRVRCKEEDKKKNKSYVIERNGAIQWKREGENETQEEEDTVEIILFHTHTMNEFQGGCQKKKWSKEGPVKRETVWIPRRQQHCCYVCVAQCEKKNGAKNDQKTSSRGRIAPVCGVKDSREKEREMRYVSEREGRTKKNWTELNRLGNSRNRPKKTHVTSEGGIRAVLT